MGHSIPQYYLKGFACKSKPQFIWEYDKLLHGFSRNKYLSIKKQVAVVQPQFYDDDTEKALNQFVEQGANHELKKLRDGGGHSNLTMSERSKFALYITVMKRRTIGSQKDLIQKVPEFFSEQELNDVAFMKKVIDEVRFSVQEMKDEHYAIYCMHWRFIKSCGPLFFLASDNPVYCPNGLVNADSELLLPLSSSLALWASNKAMAQNSNKIIGGQEYVLEINKRTVLNATQYIYYHEKVDWISKLANKQSPNFQQMKW